MFKSKNKVLKMLLPLLVIVFLFMTVNALVAEKRTPPTFGFIIKTLSNPFFVDMKKGAEEEAEKLGVKVEFGSIPTEQDVLKQLELVETMVEKGYDVLIVVPVDATNLIPGLVKATKKGILIINVDNPIDKDKAEEAGVKIETLIVSDRYKSGVLDGEFMAKALNGKGKVLIVRGRAGVLVEQLTYQGFMDVISKYPGIQIVSEQPGDWDRLKAMNIAQNVLEAHPDIAGIFCSNDNMALGTAQAVINAGRKGQVVIVGVDTPDEAKEAIKNGIMSASASQFPAIMGALGVDAAVKAYFGGKLEPITYAPVDLFTKEHVY